MLPDTVMVFTINLIKIEKFLVSVTVNYSDRDKNKYKQTLLLNYSNGRLNSYNAHTRAMEDLRGIWGR